MRTSELAERVGVNAQTLRYYERRGLLAGPRRSTSGYRDYPASALQLLRFVKRVQELGFSLDEAAEMVHLAAGGPRAM
jgi:MerR family mercuric resistance operon transcriptional regulator